MNMNEMQSRSFIKNMVMSAVDACVPKIKLGGVRKTQWMNNTVKAKLKAKKEAYKHCIQTRSNAEYNMYARA
jgi:hypothetical protein